MKIAFITTVDHNVGDDFVRDGICYLLREIVGHFELRLVHKHFPVTARPGAARLHRHSIVRALQRLPGLRGDRLSRVLDAAPLPRHGDAVLECDVLVQSGAPVYWLNAVEACEDNEWYGPLIRRRWRRLSPRPPLLNLGAGTCQAFDSRGDEFATAEPTLAYVREFFDACALTTVRDELSRRVLQLAGRTAPLLPCPSLFARRWHGVEGGRGEYVALNFMSRGGHYAFDPAVETNHWHDTFVAVARDVAAREKCVLICHDAKEEEWAERLLPEIERFSASEAADYLRVYARAKYGLVNRVHAAFALASFGRPAVLVGNDSRAQMAKLLGVEVLNVAHVTPDSFSRAWQDASGAASDFSRRMNGLLEDTKRDYLARLEPVLTACAAR